MTIRGYEMPALLQKGEVQLALVDETCAEGFEWIPLTRVPLIAVVPPTFRWERERISIGRLLKEPFITCQEQYSEKLLPPDAKRVTVERVGGGDENARRILYEYEEREETV